MDAIAVRNLTKRFGSVTAVDDLSFSVEGGSITGFVGPNGAGKTTTMRMLLGLVRPDGGAAEINGVTYAALPNPASQVGAVLEATNFHPGRTARAHLRLVAQTIGAPDAAVSAVLDQVGLAAAANRRIRGFSLGMRQRLGLATALVGNPAVLLLDEPTNGLDPEGVHWLRGFLRSRADAGATIFVSSHQLAELALSADHLVIVKAGRLVAQGTLEEITRRIGGGVIVRTPDAHGLLTALEARGISAAHVAQDQLQVRDASAQAVGAVIAETGVVVYEMRTASRDLEDAFLQLTADEGAR